MTMVSAALVRVVFAIFFLAGCLLIYSVGQAMYYTATDYRYANNIVSSLGASNIVRETVALKEQIQDQTFVRSEWVEVLSNRWPEIYYAMQASKVYASTGCVIVSLGVPGRRVAFKIFDDNSYEHGKRKIAEKLWYIRSIED